MFPDECSTEHKNCDKVEKIKTGAIRESIIYEAVFLKRIYKISFEKTHIVSAHGRDISKIVFAAADTVLVSRP